MKSLKLVFYFFLISFLSPLSTLKAQEKIQGDLTHFFTEGQRWNETLPQDKIAEENTFVVRIKEQEILYKILIFSSKGFTFVNTQEPHQNHHIPLPIKKITLSKNYLYLTNLESGFYVMRLIDLHTYEFKSPIPLFFIPTDPELGHIEEVIAQHTLEFKEKELFLKTNKKENGVLQMSFKDVEDIIKAQLISWAIQQTLLGENTLELQKLIESFHKNIEDFYQDFKTELKQLGGEDLSQLIPKELKEFNWEKSTAEELAHALAKTEENSKLQELKIRYAKRFSLIIEDFYQQYTLLIEKTNFSFKPLPAESHQVQIKTPPSQSLERNEDDVQYALKWYAGIAMGTVFVTLVLPKLFKKPFSKMAESYSLWHVRNTSWISRLFRWLHPYSSENKPLKPKTIASLLQTLTPLEKEAAHHFKDQIMPQFSRAVKQRLGDTATVIISEIIARPILRAAEDQSAANAIILTDYPFDETHSLWVQKNVLYRVIGGQLLGSITTTYNLHMLSQEYNSILKFFVLNTFADIASLTDEQKRNVARMIHKDIEMIQEEVAQKAQELKTVGEMRLTLENLDAAKRIDALKEKWLRTLEQNGAKISPRFTRDFLGAKIKSVYSLILREASLPTPERIGFLTKCSTAFGKVTFEAISKVLGKRFTSYTASTWNKSWNLWKSLNETYLFNSLWMQTLTRGSFNGSIFLYQRITSLIISTPLYIASYQAFRNRGLLSTERREFWFGLGYGLVTNLGINLIFVHVYEKNFLGTQYDLEFSKYFSNSPALH